MIRRLARGVVDALFPRLCVRCQKEGAHMCQSCAPFLFASIMDLSCPSCGMFSRIGAVCSGCESELDGLVSSLVYGNPWVSQLLKRWKFLMDREVEPLFAEVVRRTDVASVLGEMNWTVVPMPLHPRRLRERGFNQAGWIADQVGTELGAPVVPLIERSVYGRPQSRVAAGERSVQSMDGVFRPRLTVNGPVVLCDDVYTSGATMKAAAKACRQAGATQVWGYTIARG